MSNHPFLAFLPAESAAISPLYFPNSQQPFILLPPSHLDGVSSCLTMLRMLHQAPQSACHISPGHPAREGGDTCAAISLPVSVRREGGRAVSGLSDATPRGRTRTPSQQASELRSKKEVDGGSSWLLFRNVLHLLMLTVMSHLRLDVTNRKPPTAGRMFVLSSLLGTS